jgi:hypothetical protein
VAVATQRLILALLVLLGKDLLEVLVSALTLVLAEVVVVLVVWVVIQAEVIQVPLLVMVV